MMRRRAKDRLAEFVRRAREGTRDWFLVSANLRRIMRETDYQEVELRLLGTATGRFFR